MICGAGARVFPHVAAQSVGNCLALLEAEQPFMVKAGCSRLLLLMRLEAGRYKAVEERAAAKLLRLVQQPGADEGGWGRWQRNSTDATADCEPDARLQTRLRRPSLAHTH